MDGVPRQAAALLGARGWVSGYDSGDAARMFHRDSLVARVTFANGMFTPAEAEPPMIDGVHFAESCGVVALGIGIDGVHRRKLGLVSGGRGVHGVRRGRRRRDHVDVRSVVRRGGDARRTLPATKIAGAPNRNAAAGASSRNSRSCWPTWRRSWLRRATT